MANEQIIPVRVGEAAYDVTIRPGLLDTVGEHLRRLTNARRALVVADRNLVRLYWHRLKPSLESAGFSLTLHEIPAGEQSKSLEMLSATYDGFLALPLERSTPVIALGGGMTTDLAGFAAATLLRGLPFIPVPTSLLAMVDASVGGKTGINHARGKNLIGAFHQPSAVLIDPEVLRTLPPDELRSGLAECIKHDVIADAKGFQALEMHIKDALELQMRLLTGLVAHNVAIKARFIGEDPFEHGVRAHLNFGHTFGHAYETASDYRLSHGQAVALGMCSAMHASVELQMAAPAELQRVTALIAAAGLPVRAGELDLDRVMAAMSMDKKSRRGRLRFVLAQGIGSVVVRDDVTEEIVRRAVAAVIE